MKWETARAVGLVGVASAAVLAVFANAYSARHFKRFDLTSKRLYTLSEPTKQTLRELPSVVEVWIVGGDHEPLSESLRRLLVAYESETSRLEVHTVDPDRNPAAFAELRARYKLESGRGEEGGDVRDVVAIVSHGERSWLLYPADLVEVSDPEDLRVRPREERALTGAIRAVLAGQKPVACFTSGHGEPSPGDAAQGYGVFRSILERDNYETRVVDTVQNANASAYAGCSVVLVLGPRASFRKIEDEALEAFAKAGGHLLIASGPTEAGLASPKLERTLGFFGIGLREDVVLERDAKRIFAGMPRIAFVAEARDHAVTKGLLDAGHGTPPRAVVQFSRSLFPALATEGERDTAAPVALLVSSEQSYAAESIEGFLANGEAPEKKERDRSGPFVLAMASERQAASGPARAVVLGSDQVFRGEGWQVEAPLRGQPLLVLSAIGWLASKPAVLDVPERASAPAGLRITDELRSRLYVQVLGIIPAMVVAIALGLWLFRRSREGAPFVKPTERDHGSESGAGDGRGDGA